MQRDTQTVGPILFPGRSCKPSLRMRFTSRFSPLTFISSISPLSSISVSRWQNSGFPTVIKYYRQSSRIPVIASRNPPASPDPGNHSRSVHGILHESAVVGQSREDLGNVNFSELETSKKFGKTGKTKKNNDFCDSFVDTVTTVRKDTFPTEAVQAPRCDGLLDSTRENWRNSCPSHSTSPTSL